MIKHFLQTSRKVRLGGWRAFRVGPLTTMQVHYLYSFVYPIARKLDASKPVDVLVAELPLDILRVLIPLVVAQPVPDSDLQAVTREQVLALWQAICECNDVPYILTNLKTNSDAHTAFGLVDWIDALVQARSCYTHGDMLRMPFQMLLEISDCIDRMANYDPSQRLPEGAQPVTAADRAEAAKRVAAMGLELN